MSYGNIFNVLCHFSIINDVVLFGNINEFYFICTISKQKEKIKNTKHKQNEGSIYIKHNDDSYYSIKVTLIPKSNKTNKSLKELFIELLEENANDIYNNMKNDISKIKIREKKQFSYILYDIPAYIWCIATGMISTEL